MIDSLLMLVVFAPTLHHHPTQSIHHNDDLQKGRSWFFFPAMVVLVELRVRRAWGGGGVGDGKRGREVSTRRLWK